MTTHSLYAWLSKYKQLHPQQVVQFDEHVEKTRLKAELRRVTEQRDTEKRPPRTLRENTGKLRVYLLAQERTFGADYVRSVQGSSQRIFRVVRAANICS